MSTPWWRHAVVYQVYLRSFCDGDGDGTGDLAGLESKLGYLRELGVDAIWVNPWYRSPLADGGYDVADYREIEPVFGTLAQAERVIDGAHDHGLKVFADVVPNHTSDQHRWFQQALADGPGSPARDRYIFRRGRGPEGVEPPNNWIAVFGGSAWERLEDGDWYLHLFDTSQPDLNWHHPEVRQEFEAVLRFWLDRGIDGFRVDVAHGLMKDPEFGDIDTPPHALASPKSANHPHWDRDEVHEVVRDWRRVLDSYGHDRAMVAEAWVAQDRIPLYVRSDEYHQCFDFNFLYAPWHATELRLLIDRALAGAAETGSTTTWVLSNHDVVRHPTRFGLPPETDPRRWLLDGPHELLDAELGLARARAATLVMLALPGAAYLYQGEELGLHEVWDLPVEELDDPVWQLSGGTLKGRDGCRVPLPWDAKDAHLGFGGPPWLPQPDWMAEHAVSVQQRQPGSTLSMYREAIALRRRYLTDDEALRWIRSQDTLLEFERGSRVRCILNLGDHAVEIPPGEVLVSSQPVDGGRLGPNTALWLDPA